MGNMDYISIKNEQAIQNSIVHISATRIQPGNTFVAILYHLSNLLVHNLAMYLKMFCDKCIEIQVLSFYDNNLLKKNYCFRNLIPLLLSQPINI